MKHSESFTSIAAALAAAAGTFAPITRNRTVQVAMKSGGSYSFTYATLDAIVAAVRPALSANGLVLVQSVVQEPVIDSRGVESREEVLETRLIHQSGEWFSNNTPVLVSTGENSAQAYGSAITYARRYGITQLLCVVADEDDDGNAAAGNVSRSTAAGAAAPNGAAARGGAVISDKQLGMLRAKLSKAKLSEVGLCTFLKVPALEAMPKSLMDDALAAIDRNDVALHPGQAAGTASGTADPVRVAAHDAAVKVCLESLQLIRYHLAVSSDSAFVPEFGDPDPAKAADEWRSLSAQEQNDLWLAPSLGGWFTTAERTALRDAINAHPQKA